MEKRKFTRILSSIPIKIKTSGNTFETTTIDISQEGLSFYLPIELKKDIFLDIDYNNFTYKDLPAIIIFSKPHETKKNNIFYGVKLILNKEQKEEFEKLIFEVSKKKFEFFETINANIENVFQLLKNFESYPKFMKYVKEIKLYKQENELYTEWYIELDGIPIMWKEKDIINETNKTIEFCSIEGDFDYYKGKWQMKKLTEDKTKLTLFVEIIWGLPSLEKFCGTPLKIKTIKALKGMIFSVKKFLER